MGIWEGLIVPSHKPNSKTPKHPIQLLVKNLEVVAPVEEDPLREIIKDLGELQDEDDALGAEGEWWGGGGGETRRI